MSNELTSPNPAVKPAQSPWVAIAKDLRWALASLLAAVILGGGVSYYFYTELQRTQKQHRGALLERAESQGKLARAASEEEELRNKIAQFKALQERGYIGSEHRLDWMEQIAKSGGERKLASLEYEFTPQKPVDGLLVPAGDSAGRHHFVTSSQRLTAKLLHEGDLFTLLADLRRRTSAMILVRHCLLTRLPIAEGTRHLEPHLSAECNLDWVTLREDT